jgi:EF-hand domain pair
MKRYFRLFPNDVEATNTGQRHCSRGVDTAMVSVGQGAGGAASAAAAAKLRLQGQAGESNDARPVADGDDDVVANDAVDKQLAMQELKKNMGRMPPEAVFAIFDTDNDGAISFEEFKAILPQMGIEVSLPKALRYFRTCDKNGNGVIDLDEFKVGQLVCE